MSTGMQELVFVFDHYSIHVLKLMPARSQVLNNTGWTMEQLWHDFCSEDLHAPLCSRICLLSL